jgi:hypothetical protein
MNCFVPLLKIHALEIESQSQLTAEILVRLDPLSCGMLLATESRRGGGRSWGVASLGHPDGRGAVAGRGEYLGGGGDEGDRQRRRGSLTFGTGNSKWVRRKEFRPWTPAEGHVKGVGKYRGNGRLYGWARASEEEKQDSDGVQDTDYGLQDT